MTYEMRENTGKAKVHFLYGTAERYDTDELMLTLSYDDSVLISSWHALRKEHPIFIESEEEIKGVYFEKIY